jgi:hypothetical protein
LTINDGTFNRTITDNSALDLNPAVGTLALIGYSTATNTNGNIDPGVGGNTTFLDVTGASSTAPGSSSQAKVQLMQLTIKNDYTHPITVTMTYQDNTFTAPGSPGASASLFASMTFLTFTGTVSLSDVANYSDGGGGSATTGTTPATLINLGSATGTTSFTREANPFTLQGVSTITLSSGATLSFQSEADVNGPSAVPEPSTMLLTALGGGVLTACYTVRRRKANTACPGVKPS